MNMNIFDFFRWFSKNTDKASEILRGHLNSVLESGYSYMPYTLTVDYKCPKCETPGNIKTYAHCSVCASMYDDVEDTVCKGTCSGCGQEFMVDMFISVVAKK